MKIRLPKIYKLQAYILRDMLRYLLLSSATLTTIFVTFDFFDRIDVILRNDPSLGQIIKYFLLKIPGFLNLTLPIAVVIATLLTIGLLSKNSELTAMRAAGLKVLWLCKPIIYLAFLLSLFAILINETFVPYTARRAREIYNLDIQKKDQSGVFNKENLWWRSGGDFFSANMFDSRDNRLIGLTQLNIDDKLRIRKRSEAKEANWLGKSLNWSMHNVTSYRVDEADQILTQNFETLPLPIEQEPQEFYRVETDPAGMTRAQLGAFIEKQRQNGLPADEHLADFHSKLSSPFVIFVCTLIAIPLALRPARTGSMAASFISGLGLSFSYYAVMSLSLAFGRAAFWPPMIAAWMANILLLAMAIILLLAVEEAE